MMEFQEFAKIARLSRECVITEKIDGTNAQVHIVNAHDCESNELPARYVLAHDVAAARMMLAGSRSRYIIPEADNHGWAAWVQAHVDQLWALGEGRHYGEWWGSGIQRGYGLTKGDKRFSLFNVARWHAVGSEPYISISQDPRQPPKSSTEAPACCSVVPVLYRGEFTTEIVGTQIERLRTLGSAAAPGYMNAEGVIIYHVAANLYFKKTLDRDAEHKGQLARV